MMEMTSSAAKVVPPHVPAHLVVDFDIYNPPGVADDAFLAWNRLHDDGVPDLVWSPYNGGHWIATRGKEIYAIYKDSERFSSRVKSVPRPPAEMFPLIPFASDAPLHSHYRAVVAGYFTPKAIDGIMSDARRWAIELIEGFRSAGGCEFVGEFALKMPIGVVMTLLDLPWEDRDELIGYTEIMTRGADPQAKNGAFAATMAYLGKKVAERRAAPGKDVISVIVGAQVQGRPLTQQEILGMCGNLLFGGLDTVTSTLGFVAKFLAEHPTHRARLAADPSKAGHAVDELLRRFAVANPGRVVAEDMEYNGVQMKKDDLIILPGSLHGMDEREFPNALEVDFDRKGLINSVFGNGPHRCLGSYLARSELKMFLEEWFARIPDFRIPAGEKAITVSGMVNGVDRLPLVWS